jgi:2-methylisocitrate lyase-like PEP mutase family enzyme
MNQSERARYFLQLHDRRPLILPNAWDAGSARVIEAAGAAAIATTSAGLSWSFGRTDGQKLRRQEMIQAVRNIVEVVDIPVTADIESGYGSSSSADVAETVQALISIGVTGVNIEDSPGRDGQALLSREEHAERIRVARETAVAVGSNLVINARTDVYFFAVGKPETRLEAVAKRARLYRRAGADCVFVPGVIDISTIAELVKTIEGPLNIMAMPGAPSAKQLGEIGVARVSVGPWIAQAALTAAQRAACELVEQGTYTSLETSLPFAELNAMFVQHSEQRANRS